MDYVAAERIKRKEILLRQRLRRTAAIAERAFLSVFEMIINCFKFWII